MALGDILDFIVGNRNEEQTTTVAQSTDTNTEKSSIQAGTQSKSTEGAKATEGKSDTDTTQNVSQSFLDSGVRTDVEGFIKSLVAGPAAGAGQLDNVTSLNNLIRDRASGVDAATTDQINAIIGAARNSGEQALTRQITGAATTAGSSMNSIVQDLAMRGRGDLETQLAGLAGQLGLDARKAGTEELGVALSGAMSEAELAGSISGEKAKSIASLVDVLKGATSESSTTGKVSTLTSEEEAMLTNELTKISEALQEFVKGKGITTTTQDSEGSRSGTLFDFISAFN